MDSKSYDFFFFELIERNVMSSQININLSVLLLPAPHSEIGGSNDSWRHDSN